MSTFSWKGKNDRITTSLSMASCAINRTRLSPWTIAVGISVMRFLISLAWLGAHSPACRAAEKSWLAVSGGHAQQHKNRISDPYVHHMSLGLKFITAMAKLNEWKFSNRICQEWQQLRLEFPLHFYIVKIIVTVDFLRYVLPFILLKNYNIFFIIYFIIKENWNITYNFTYLN
jgi:hypothetical protein